MYKSNRQAISLFSGCGGMDLGIKQAGFDILIDIEKDPHCCETLRTAKELTHDSVQIIESDIREINPQELMCDLHITAGELDLLFGGPPCQSFSQIGKQKSLQDERGMLLFEMIRFTKILMPKVVFIEQVKGLINAPDIEGNKGGVLQKLLTEFEELGYTTYWQVINAADYGIAQVRKRVFIIATQHKQPFVFPDATHSPNGEYNFLYSRYPYITVGDVIADLQPPLPKGAVCEKSHIDVTPPGDRFRINGVPDGSYLAAQAHLPKDQIKGLTKKDTTKFLRTSFNEPAKTLRCGEIFFHPTENRYLTPREYMRIHGYPDDYLLKGPIRGRSGRVRDLDQYRQIANSVPPMLAKVIAEQIMETLICHKSMNSLVTH